MGPPHICPLCKGAGKLEVGEVQSGNRQTKPCCACNGKGIVWPPGAAWADPPAPRPRQIPDHVHHPWIPDYIRHPWLWPGNGYITLTTG